MTTYERVSQEIDLSALGKEECVCGDGSPVHPALLVLKKVRRQPGVAKRMRFEMWAWDGTIDHLESYIQKECPEMLDDIGALRRMGVGDLELLVKA